MESPINNMIDRAGKRKAAMSKKAKAQKGSALNDQVLSLVHEANATALPERHVTPRAALIVMARAMKELASLPEDSRNHGVLREVTKFISLNQKTLLASVSTKHADLLPQGHPLSPLNASLTDSELRKKYAEWIAADPAIADDARSLVAMAHSLPPASIEREHAFLRLRTLQASVVPAYFKIDDVSPIVAAFSSGNSSAARRARVALQWRDRFGRWIEMGRGVNFRFRMPDGSIATGKGNYVGAGSTPRVERTSSGVSLTSDSGLIEVSGVPGLAPGLYAIDSKNAAAYQARIPGFEAPQAPSFDDQFDADIPSIADLQAARRDLPIGWKKQGPYYVSDDNYAVIPGPNGQPQALTRLNSEGRPAATVGNARNWSEVNDLIEKDQPSFDKEIARIEAEGEEGRLPLARIPGATEEDVVDFDEIVGMQQQRAEENKRFDESRPAPKPLGDKDLNGNVVPKSWTRDTDNDTRYTREMPLRDGGSYPILARLNDDGTYIAGHSGGWIPEPGTDGRGASRKFESWREIESSIPEFVDYLNEGFTKDNPIEYAPQTSERKPGTATQDERPQGMTLDFADPEQAAEDAGLPEDTPFNEIVKAWFDQNIKPVAPTARLEKSEEGGITPSVSITADNEKDLLNAFRVYMGDDEATIQDLRDNSEPYTLSAARDSSGDLTPTYEDAVKVSEDTTLTPSQKLHELFKNAKTMPLKDYIENNEIFQDYPIDPSVDIDNAEIVEVDGDGQVVVFRYPDNTYHTMDAGGYTEIDGVDYISSVSVDSLGEDAIDDYFRDLLDTEDPTSGPFYRGYWIDEDLQRDFLASYPDGEGPDEEPPSPGGGTPPKVPSPSTPGSPALFTDFDTPAGAFQLRTTEYEPEGRVDEASTDFTDDPRRLATKFSLDDLVTAFTEALIGRPSDEAMQDILDANVTDDNELPDLDDLGDVANSPARRAGEVSGPGAGALEFNAGEEYVQAEALYNAVYEAGGDPNRVIANAYDAVNGNRNNARKLLEAQGGVPSEEEAQLIEDMTDEIRQIKDASPDDEISAGQKRSEPEKTFLGELIENVPVDFNNPDYFDMDTDAYIPSVPEIDENGYTDNPEILALDYESTDLIEQMIEGITDGSGVALLDFGGEDGVHEVPVEALRDALQLQEYNTNKILFDLRDESNDMSEEPTLSREDIRWDAQKGLYTDVNGKVLDGDTVDAAGLDSSLRDAPDPDIQVLQPTSSDTESRKAFTPFLNEFKEDSDTDDMLEDLAGLDRAADAAVEFFANGLTQEFDFIGFNPETESVVVITPGTDGQEPKVLTISSDGSVRNPSMFSSDAAIDFISGVGTQFGWQPMPQRVKDAIFSESMSRFPDRSSPQAVQLPNAPADETPVEAPVEAPEAPSSTFMYPGPREAGYSVNNTTLASDGSVVGAGSIVTANRDGKRGTVVSIQNDPEYVRIKFDDGKVAVRSANQIKAVSNPDGSLALAPSGSVAPTPAVPSTDVAERLKAPAAPGLTIARPTASWGINDSSEVPDEIKPLVQEKLQADFAEWGDRSAEIANAANTRVSFDALFKASQEIIKAQKDRDPAAEREALQVVRKLLSDAYGQREGVSFGAEKFTIAIDRVYFNNTGDLDSDADASFRYTVAFSIKDKNDRVIGEGGRYISSKVSKNADGTLRHETTVENKILKIRGANKKKGFATAYNRHMENWYIANGVNAVEVYAAGDGNTWTGGFVWALNGFDWRMYTDAENAMRSLNRLARTPEDKEIVKRLLDRLNAAGGDVARVPTPLEFALAGWYPGAENWLGKEVMSSKSWNGVKRLKPNFREQQQALNYNQIKSADRRVKAGQNKANMSGNALAQVMDNEFQVNNPELGAYMEQIRDALKNNRPLGFLSPSAKSALNAYVSKQLLDKDSKMPMDDLFRLRNALDAEYRADYDFADPFGGINEEITRFSLDDFRSNSDELKAAGFVSFALNDYERGQNTTFKVIHKPSGQVFFVKEEHLSQEWNGERGLTNEVEANIVLNALGMHGIPDVRGSVENPDVFIMSQAGATIPLAGAPINAEKMFYQGITDANGQNAEYSVSTFVEAMANPEDLLSMAIIDMLGDSEDRHDGNWMVAFDSTNGKLRIFPIDHGLSRIQTDDDSIRSFLSNNWPSAGDVYQYAVPRLIDLAGEARTKEMFLNQVDKLIKNLDNPLFQPKGEELAALIEKWGSYDAFKDAMKERLTRIVTPGTPENDGINRATKKAYWR